MNGIVVATDSGCRVFNPIAEEPKELPGLFVSALAHDGNGGCLAVVNKQEIWRRSAQGSWYRIAKTGMWLQSIVSIGDTIYGGGMDHATMVRIPPGGEAEHLKGFDLTPGRGEWFAGGPPLGVRALAKTADNSALLAAVHVGGVPRSTDGGETWAPTMPVKYDVHEVCSHPDLPNIVAAATAIGLGVSHDRGQTWKVFAEGLETPYSLAVASLPYEMLFSIQDGPFAKRSQVWRWTIAGTMIEQVRDGLPEWLEGKIDTAHIAANGSLAAVMDGAGNLWVSSEGSTGWDCLAKDLQFALGLLIV